MTDDATLIHGGPDGGGPVRHDFSTNANACGPCPTVLEAVRRADAACYPDPGYTALRETLADFHGVEAGRIVIAASASEFIFRITAAVARRGGRHVELPPHGYGDYARAARAWGLEPVGTGTVVAPIDTLVWHCDPSSPLGQAVPALGARIDSLAPSSVCVLDLAYEPLRLDGVLDLTAAQRDRIWQLWTPNKALGLTGVRAAYAIAPRQGPDLSATLRSLAPSWAVGAHGVAMLVGWCDASTQGWLQHSRDTLRGWRERQLALCAELRWPTQPTIANFFCADPGVGTVAVLATALRDRRIKVRDAASFGLQDRIRMAVLHPDAQDALREAVTAIRAFPRPASAPASCSRRPS